MISDEKMKLWLDPSTDAEKALQLFDDPELDWFRVSSAVNTVLREIFSDMNENIF